MILTKGSSTASPRSPRSSAAVRARGSFPGRTTAAALLGFTWPRPRARSSGSPLVVRNQVRLGLAGARAIIAGAQAKAQWQ